jgi:hypothetical protein
VIRTDFSDQRAWEAVRATLESLRAEFTSELEFLDDPAYRDLTTEQILAVASNRDDSHYLLIVVDKTTLASDEMPLLLIDLDDGQIRATPAGVTEIEVNLVLSNMDFEEFAEAADESEDGVFRGFLTD